MTTPTATEGRPATVRTFDEAFGEHRLTYRERELLVHHLAGMRSRKTIEVLLPRCRKCEGRGSTGMENAMNRWYPCTKCGGTGKQKERDDGEG